MLQRVDPLQTRDWFRLQDQVESLPAEAQETIQSLIERDKGARAGYAPLGYIFLLAITILFSSGFRYEIDWFLLPGAVICAGALLQVYLGRQLTKSTPNRLSRLSRLSRAYSVASLATALAWSLMVGIVRILLDYSFISDSLFVATVVITSISVGAMTQEKPLWLYFLAMLWTPLALSSAIVAGIDHTAESMILCLISVLFPLLLGIHGLRVVNEYLQSQLTRANLSQYAEELQEALSRQREAEKERLAMEQQLRQAQKLEAIGQLAAGIAHEINTPVQYVSDNTRFLQEAFADFAELQAKQREWINDNLQPGISTEKLDELTEEADLEYLMEEIPKAATQSMEGLAHIAKIVRAMKEFSHPGATDQELVDLSKAIGTVIEISRNEWKYHCIIETEFDEKLPTIPAYTNELNQVILNIIVNAAHAIRDRVETGEQTRGTIKITTRHTPPWATLQIADDGAGIPENIRSKIFDPFFTTKGVGKGTGQGLAIAYSVVVEKHQGTIAVDSVPGAGSTFTIQLPLEAPEQQQVQH